MNRTDLVDQASLRDDVPAFGPGDNLKVHVRVVEGSKQRLQVFQGVVIRPQGGGLQETFTVRKQSNGWAMSDAPSSTTCGTGSGKPPRSRKSASEHALRVQSGGPGVGLSA